MKSEQNRVLGETLYQLTSEHRMGQPENEMIANHLDPKTDCIESDAKYRGPSQNEQKLLLKIRYEDNDTTGTREPKNRSIVGSIDLHSD